MRVLISPFSTMVVTRSASESVTRRPPTKRVRTPSFCDSSVDCGPPPWTSTTRTPSSKSSATCSTRSRMLASAATAAPPVLMTKVLPPKRFR